MRYRARSDLHRDDVDLLVVFDGEHYEKPFQAAAEERTWSAWKWTQLDDSRASYETSHWLTVEFRVTNTHDGLILMGRDLPADLQALLNGVLCMSI